MKNFITSLLIIVMIAVIVSCRQETTQQEAIPRKGYFTGADSLQLYYQFEGSGPDTVVMIHGGPGMDATYMIADFEPLAKNHVLLYYDQRGGGRSELPDTAVATSALHIDRHIADLEALRQHFSLSSFHLMGHSFGSIIAGMYAVAYPENVSSMMLIGAVPPYAGDFGSRYDESLNGRLSKDELNQLDSLSNEMITGTDPRAACIAYWNIGMKPRIAADLEVSIIKGDCCSAPVEAIRYGYKYTGSITFASLGNWDFREGLKRVTAPTLLIHGVEESIPMDMIEAWTTVLPNSELKRIEKAAHFPYVEQPDVVWPMMEEFLATVSKR
jgi:proline iminopeptidase